MYQRLAQTERYQIHALLKSGLSMRSTARLLNRSASTISREIKVNRFKGCPYVPDIADERSKGRTYVKNQRTRKIKNGLEEYIRERIQRDWSPEQIVGRMRIEKCPHQVSHETIYRSVYRWALSQKDFTWKHLRRHRRTRRHRKDAIHRQNPMVTPNKVSISERPKIVDHRSRIGDYERDTLLGTKDTAVLLSVMDRKSRWVGLRWMPKKTAIPTHEATLRILKNKPVHTITNDNGLEFYMHETTGEKLKANIYFSRPYRPWERGSIENLQGLLRQYFPRNKDLTHVSLSKVKEAQKRLNARPRKCLAFKTPEEVFRQERSNVALAV